MKKIFTHICCPLFKMSHFEVIIRLKNWLRKHYLASSTLLLTAYFTIVSIYGKIFSENPPECWLKPSDHITFLENQKNDNLTQDISCENSTYYNHLFIIDRTFSTTNTKNLALSNFLKSSLRNKGIEANSDSSIKSLLFLNMCGELLKSKINRSLQVLFYDTDSVFTNAIDERNRNGKNHFHFPGEWIDLTKDNNNSVAALEEVTKLPFEVWKPEQKTWIYQIFKKIHDVIKQDTSTTKFIATIFSDFVNDECNSPIEHIEELVKLNNFEQINYIHLLSNMPSEQQASIDLIDYIKTKMSGVKFFRTPIEGNQKWTRDKYEILEKELIQCFSIKPDSIRIKHFYPYRKHERGYETTEAQIKLNHTNVQDTLSWHWRIVSPYIQETTRTPVFYQNNKKENRSCAYVDDRVFHEVKHKDTLSLYFPISHHIHFNQYELEVTCGEITKTFPVKFQEKIPVSIAKLAIWIIHLFLILLFLCICMSAISPVDALKYYHSNPINKENHKVLFYKYLINLMAFILISLFLVFGYASWSICNGSISEKFICIVAILILLWFLCFQILNIKAIKNLRKHKIIL
jgi:hypothetical protein